MAEGLQGTHPCFRKEQTSSNCSLLCLKIGKCYWNGRQCRNLLSCWMYTSVVMNHLSLHFICTLNCSKVSFFGCAYDLVLAAQTTQALPFLRNAPTSKLYTLLLKVNVQKSCIVVFRDSNKTVSTNLTMKNQPLRQVMEITYKGVLLTDDLSCAKDVVRSKLAFFKHVNSTYERFSFVDTNVLLHFFRLHAMGNSYSLPLVIFILEAHS